MSTTLSKFYIYTTHPLQEFEQSPDNSIQILDNITSNTNNNYDNILIIIGGSCWNHNQKYDIICKNVRMSLENYVDGKNLIINIDGVTDKLKPKDNKNNKYIHLDIFLSYDENCPFIIKLFEFINTFLERNTKICIINSVFEYSNIISSKFEISNIFNRYNKNKNIKVINIVNFPSNELNSRYDISVIILRLISNYKKEFMFWKKIYSKIYGKDYMEDIKCNNLRLITFDTFLLYFFNSFFVK